MREEGGGRREKGGRREVKYGGKGWRDKERARRSVDKSTRYYRHTVK